MNVFVRMWKFVSGMLSLRIGNAEKGNPAIVFENAINALGEKYINLKHAASAVIARCITLEKRISDGKNQLCIIECDLEEALKREQDDVALVLIEHKQRMESELETLNVEFKESSEDAEDSKSSLGLLKTKIVSLRNERDTSIARLQSAEARLSVQKQLSESSMEVDLKALEGVRENINNKLAEIKLTKELGNSDIDTKMLKIRRDSSKVKAKTTLEEMKRNRASRTLPEASVSKKAVIVDSTFVVDAIRK